MINSPNNTTIQFNWLALLWRLLLTLLLLLALAGPGLTIFRSLIDRPGTQALPSLTHQAEVADPGAGEENLLAPVP